MTICANSTGYMLKRSSIISRQQAAIRGSTGLKHLACPYPSQSGQQLLDIFCILSVVLIGSRRRCLTRYLAFGVLQTEEIASSLSLTAWRAWKGSSRGIRTGTELASERRWIPHFMIFKMVADRFVLPREPNPPILKASPSL